jgi:uncharacterized RDD family membrane protein YckC
MSFGSPYQDDDFLTGGCMSRRCIAWIIDVVLIAILVWILWWLLFMFGLITFGLGFGAMAALPAVPFFYHFLSLLSWSSATPGQRVVGVTVRRDYDLGPPTALQALIAVLVFWVTMATSGLLLLVALFTTRHRTFHDLLSGLVVVRSRALTTSGGGWNMGTSLP